MKWIKIKWNKKDEKKPCDVYVLFNGRVTELIGSKIRIKFEIKNFNLKFRI